MTYACLELDYLPGGRLQECHLSTHLGMPCAGWQDGGNVLRQVGVRGKEGVEIAAAGMDSARWHRVSGWWKASTHVRAV